MTAAMTNTGFVALPILHAVYGQPAVLPAAVATVFVAEVMPLRTLCGVRSRSILRPQRQMYIPANQYNVEEPLVAATVSLRRCCRSRRCSPGCISSYLIASVR